MRRTIVAGIAATSFLLAACGGGDDDAADEGDAATTTEAVEETTTTATAEAEETTTTEADDGNTVGGGGGQEPESDPDAAVSASGPATEDGTVIAVGEPATVVHEATNGEIDLEIVVDEVVASSWADLEAAGLQLEETDKAGVVPYFIRYSATLQSDVAVGGTGLNTEFDGVTTDGDLGGTLITVGLDECRNESFRTDDGPGAVLEGCKVTLLPEDATLLGARWEGQLTDGITWEA